MTHEDPSVVPPQRIADLEHRLTRAILELFFSEHRDEIVTELGDAGRGVGWQAAKFAFHDILLNDLYNFPGDFGLHNLTTPIIEIGPDGRRAKGMWFSLGFQTHRLDNGTKILVIQPGQYFHTFVKESDGLWKYLTFQWQVIFRTPLNEGWVHTSIAPGPTMKNDVRPVTEADHPYSPDELSHFPPLPPTPETFETYFVGEKPAGGATRCCPSTGAFSIDNVPVNS